MFELAALILGKEKEFPVGTFQIINTNSNYDIINQLVNESPEVIKVRILEGWDTRKIASYLAEVMSFDSTVVMELSRDRDFISQNGLDVNSLEDIFSQIHIFFSKVIILQMFYHIWLNSINFFGIKHMKLEQIKSIYQNMR